MQKKIYINCLILVLVLIFYFITYKVSYNHKNQSEINNEVSLFQEQFLNYEKLLLSNLANISLDIKTNGLEYVLSNKNFSANEFKYFVFYIFKNDTLIFWSDNSIPINNHNQIKQLDDGSLFQTANSYVYLSKNVVEDYIVYGFIPIYFQYHYQNKFLQNKFSQNFENFHYFDLCFEPKSSNYIKNLAGKNLFNLCYNSNPQHLMKHSVLTLFAFSVSVFLLILLIFRLFNQIKLRWHFKAVLILIILVLLRYLQIKFRFPDFLYSNDLFNPVYYAWNLYFSSLGDVFLNIYTLFVFALLFYFKFNQRAVIVINSIKANFLAYISSLSIIIVFYLVYLVLRSLIFHSVLNISFNDIFKFQVIDIIGFVIIVLLMFVFMKISFIFLLFIRTNTRTHKRKIIQIFLFLLSTFAMYCFESELLLPLVFLFIFYIISLILKPEVFSLSKTFAILTIVLFTFSNGFLINKFNYEKEKLDRKLFAFQKSSEQDPILEFLFIDIESRIQNDTVFINLFKNKSTTEEELEKYLAGSYFGGYFSNYHFQVTLCKPGEFMLLLPSNIKTECKLYFESLKSNLGNTTNVNNLWFLNDGTGRSSYLFEINLSNKINIDDDTLPKSVLYIELVRIPKIAGLGLPELLVDEKIISRNTRYEYSYAKYFNSQLIHQFGDYFYPLNFQVDDKGEFFKLNNFSHYLYRINDQQFIIVSSKIKTTPELLSVFSYLFLIFIVGYYLLTVIVIFIANKLRFRFISFKAKLQTATVLLVIVSFIVAGVISINYFVKYNNDKKNEAIREKSFSLLIDIEHRLSQYDELTVDDRHYLTDILVKLSNVFFTDINLYSPGGELLATSRPQVFNFGLLSNRINSQYFFNATKSGSPFFLHEEYIGNLEFSSAYLPFFNYNNQLIAYLNLPYFAKEAELQRDISTFLVTFINFYVFLIVLAIILALVAAKYITLPLKLISEKLRKIKPGQINEKIFWKQQDEIGVLVNEYNKMIEQLETSTNQLMQSERESAWKEMAKQIAHEIKNPLTPMKLSLQNLNRAWNDGLPDYENRLRRTSQTLIEQIDTLAKIADEFSNFARLREPKLVETNLITIIHDIINLYESEKINIKLNHDTSSEYKIMADDRLLIQVFNNIVKNAVQSIPEAKNGEIEISLIRNEKNIEVRVVDNGVGISEDYIHKVFSPYFTSKTGGTGLGLAITKEILVSMNSEITFNSKFNHGTEFIICFPLNLE